MKKYAIVLFSFGVTLCYSMEPTALTNAALFVKTRGFESERFGFEVMSNAVKANDWTRQECTDLLKLTYDMFRNSTNSFDVGCARHAVALLGKFGSTNAIPVLQSIMQNDEGSFKSNAGRELFRVCLANGESLEALKNEMAGNSSVDGVPFAWHIYRHIQSELAYSGPNQDELGKLLRFLLEQAPVERLEFAFLDEILCREVPKWRASPQRAANAEKMIREHPEDVRLVAFFENVRSNALESARAATSEGSSTNDVPAKGSCEKAPTKSTFDPWADLLENLPEKEPWTPPPGTQRPY